ncbi:MAG: hypothetical protein D6767_01865 [Candidatus Hydrogenedentota bacterium]|nr:MAG: hypothetical protein D6767_01865 [Candidatus Hydrogenedentota bacterium]
MKKTDRFKVVIGFLSILWVWPVFANMASLAEELSKGANKLKTKRIAVLKFDAIGQVRESFRTQVADGLTYELVKTGKFVVLERSQVETILHELSFEQTGVIDSTSARKVGKGLGAEALVIGTIVDNGEDYTITAKLIRSETFDIIAIARTNLPKSTSTHQSTTSIKTYTEYIDVFAGQSKSLLDMEFSNPADKVNSTYLSFVPANTLYSNIRFQKLKMKDAFVLGAKYEAFYKYGGVSLEYAHFEAGMQKQIAAGKFDGTDNPNFDFSADEYLRVSHNVLTLAVMGGYSFSFFTPYIGAGIGLNLASISSDFIYAYNYNQSLQKNVFTKGLKEISIGVLFLGKAGLRIAMSPALSLFAEGRVFTTSLSFTREISNEDDSVKNYGWQWIAGVGFNLNSL